MPYADVGNVMKGAEGIESVIGPLARSYSSIDVFMKAVIAAQPWLYDSRVIERVRPTAQSEIKYFSLTNFPSVPLCSRGKLHLLVRPSGNYA